MSPPPLQKSNKLIYRIDNESRSVCSKTILQILSSGRKPRSFFRANELISNYDQVQNEFSQLILYTREIIENSLIQNPEFQQEFGITSEIVKSSQVIRKELELFESSSDLISDPIEIKSFFPFIQNELVRMDQKIRCFEQMKEYAVRIFDLWESIENESPNRTNSLVHLSQRIIHDSIPHQAIYLSSYDFLKELDLEKNEANIQKIKLLSQSIHSARIATWVSRQFKWNQTEMESLVISSLLMDIGKVRQINVINKKQVDLKTNLQACHREHASLGAAIYGEFNIHPVKIPRLISQHHERHDGSGFPNKLTGDELSKEASILIILSRLTEVHADLFYEKKKRVRTDSNLWSKAMTKVIKESEEGLFDRELTKFLTDNLGFEWRDTSPFVDDNLQVSHTDRKHSLKPPHYRQQKQRRKKQSRKKQA